MEIGGQYLDRRRERILGRQTVPGNTVDCVMRRRKRRMQREAAQNLTTAVSE